MKFLTTALVVLSASISLAGTKLSKVEDEMVPASLVEDLQKIESKDQKIAARLISVYRGTAYGITSLFVVLVDQGPVEGDYANTSTFELSGLVSEPTSVRLVGMGGGKYQLSFVAKIVGSLDSNGEAKIQEKSFNLLIKLNSSGTVTSVEMK